MEYGSNFIYAFTLTLLAGLSTGLGAIIVLGMKRTNTKFLSAALGFSAGVMIYVSFVEMLPTGIESINHFFGQGSDWIGVLFFFVGVAFIAIIDWIIPEDDNPHEYASEEDLEKFSEMRQVKKVERPEKNGEKSAEDDLHRTGIMSALAIGIHNFPEGMATFMSALVDPSLGLSIAIAIAIHNIPEGISVAVPIYYSSGNKKKAIGISLLSGLAEPIGALVAALLLMPFLNDGVFGIIFSLVAGIMVYISLDELLPSAEKYGAHHLAIYGVISGMIVMAVSLLLLG